MFKAFQCKSSSFYITTTNSQLVVVFLILFLCKVIQPYALENEPKAADLVLSNQRIDVSEVKYQTLFDELITKHGFNNGELLTIFKNVSIDRKVLQLMDKQWEEKPYHQYRPRFISPQVISDGKKLLSRYKQLLDQVENQYGVNREYIVAIWAIESKYGTYQGRFRVFRTLNTLFAAYPRRSKYFGKELIDFIVLCRNNKLNPLQINGSYAGAFGQAQFMPSSYLHYAIDFDNDNNVDLINSHADIFASIANYLKNSGWILDAPVYAEIGNTLNSELLIKAFNKGRKGRVDWRLIAKLQNKPLPGAPKGSNLSIIGLDFMNNGEEVIKYFAGYVNFQAITEYNHSHKYAMVVAELALEYTR